MKYLMIIAYILVSCSTKSTNNSTKNDEQNLIVIDVTKKHPEKIVYAQDIADIEYIPLETNDSTLIDRRKPDVVSEQYIVYHNQNGQVLVFLTDKEKDYILSIAQEEDLKNMIQ